MKSGILLKFKEICILSDGKISEEIRAFMFANIDSVGIVEVLALLLQNQDKDWTCRQISQELRNNEDAVQRHLNRLLDLRIVNLSEDKPPLYRYAADTQLATTVEGLIDAFTTYPARVIEIIFNRPNEALRKFADAFKIRKDTEDG